MIKLGILDFDTSHCVEFTRRLNHVEGTAKDQFVDGAQIVIGCAGESKLSPERIEGFTTQMKKFGVPLVEKPADMIGKVDGMLIEAVDGTVHFERARPFLEAGIPCFIDKPFTCSVADAKSDPGAVREEESRRSSRRHRCGTRRRWSSTWPIRSRASSSAATVYGPRPLSPIPERNAGLYPLRHSPGRSALHAHGARLPAGDLRRTRRAWTS